MIRRTRRSGPSTAVAVIGLGAAAAVATGAVQSLLGAPPLVSFQAVTALGSQLDAAAPVVIGAAALAGVVGLILLWWAISPGPVTVVAVADDGTGIDTGIHRAGLDRALARAAGGVGHVTRATARTHRNSVTVHVRTTTDDAATLRADVESAVTDTLTALAPGAGRRVRIRIAGVTERSS